MNKKILIGTLIGLILIGTVFAAGGKIKPILKEIYKDGNEMLSYIEYFETTKDYSLEIVDITQTNGNNEIEVFWKLEIFDPEPYQEEECTWDEEDPMAEPVCVMVDKIRKNMFRSETLSSRISETASDSEIEALVKKHAMDVYNNWQPELVLAVNKSIIGKEISLE